MAQPQSRLQLLGELQRLDREHAAATVTVCTASTPPDADLDDVFERYSYGELRVIADFLAADIQRLHAARGG